jgi:hypothetical protein
VPLAVPLAWLVSRAIVAAVLLGVGGPPGARGTSAFARWDGGWYLQIAGQGYGFAHADGKTPYPFFPLLPALLRAGAEIGVPMVLVGAVLSHVALLAALLGLHELVRERFSGRAADCAVWALALFPGSTPLSMVYPSSILLAVAIWAFVALERGRAWIAGGLAAAAALVRPNGAAVAVALAVAAACNARLRRHVVRLGLPACLAVATWMAVLWSWTGDPLVFLHAKSAWQEVTLASVLTGHAVLPKLDVMAAAFAGLVLIVSWRDLPVSWLVFAALWLLPPFVLGMLGMPRYVSTCFPVFAALGSIGSRSRPALVNGALALSAAGLAVLAARIGGGRMMP